MFPGMYVVKQGTKEEHYEWDFSHEDEYLISRYSLVENAELAWYFGFHRGRNVFYRRTEGGDLQKYTAASPAHVHWMRPALKKPALIPGVLVSKERGFLTIGEKKEMVLESIARREAKLLAKVEGKE